MKLLERSDLAAAAQLHPELDPHAVAVDEVLEVVDLLVAPAIGVAGALHLELRADAVRHEQLLDLVERAVVQVVELRRRRPLVEHADDLEVVAVEPHGLADAVGAAEGLVVGLLRQHHDHLRGVVRRLVPAGAVLERHVEHAEEILGRRASLDEERRDAALRRRLDHERRLAHHHFAVRDVGRVQRLRVAIRQLRRRQLRVVVAPGVVRIPAVERDRIEHVVAMRDRVAGHQPVHGQRRDAHADADRDRADHQRGQHRIAAQALESDTEVVGKHGG